MAKINFLNIDDTSKALYNKGLKQSERFVFSSISSNKKHVSRKLKDKLKNKNYLTAIKELWDSLTPTEQAQWSTCGVPCSMSGYNLFVQDCSFRIKNNFSGIASPSILHQFKVGRIKIASPATSAKISQKHSREYWLVKNVLGKKTMQEPSCIVEDFSLPLKIGLNYSSNLTSVGPDSSAIFYASVWYTYKGENLHELLEIPLDFVSDWKHAENTLSTISGDVVSYDLFFEITNLQGELFFDNVEATHSFQNWAFDKNCNDINNIIQQNFFTTVKNWKAENVPAGAEYNSIYKDF